ncbi:DUF3393 domain-containing protein [Sulfurimonas lithotrophica]|uniref:DUF3393 domain-containing protein n=1 Tax=Sulfurimonas lithotrophica TaxID=2590022 RepID=A0A5P8P0S5_9BACT|nr:murein transglycosylase domain-containing protein [Sulfurimonas lithotrophica]QFR49187.1 DUF3393 domain-containing protein [Sulfurimonas lithotrophica]
MRIFVLFVLALSFFGCSTKVPCNCKCPKCPKDESKVFVYNEPEITVYKEPQQLSKAQVYYKKQVSYVRKKAAPYWGEKAQVADKFNYVKYAKDFKARTIINFQNGVIRVETTDTANPLRTLKEVIASTLLNTQNPETVDLFSSRHTIHVGEPFLFNRVKDHDGEPIRWVWRANRYAQHLIDTGLKKDAIKTSTGVKKRYYVTFKMKQDNYSNSSELNYASIVKKQAKRFGLEPALIFALIETESHFNQFATSAIPAYGLMQVVPHSAGRDAWEFLTQRPGQPTRNYLFDARNNIEMGSAYVHILFNRYLSDVKNPENRELCVIAAYNTGSGNVLRSFHKNKDIAVSKINRLSPDALYKHLRQKLPYKETRDYIKKVTSAKKHYL